MAFYTKESINSMKLDVERDYILHLIEEYNGKVLAPKRIILADYQEYESVPDYFDTEFAADQYLLSMGYVRKSCGDTAHYTRGDHTVYIKRERDFTDIDHIRTKYSIALL